MPPKKETREHTLKVPMNWTERKQLKAHADSKGLSEAATARMYIKEGIERTQKKP